MIGFIFSFFGFKIRRRFYNRRMIEAYQLKNAKKVASYAAKNSKFFRKLYKGRSINDFFILPAVNKSVMMENLTDYNTLGLVKEELVDFALKEEKKRDFSARFKGLNVAMSSGTSGNKGIFFITPKEEELVKTMYLARLVLPNEKVNCAFILRVTSPAFNYSKFGNRLAYVSQLQPMQSIIRQLEEISPNVVSGPPSMLKLLAIEQKKGALAIKPKILYSYAEVLYPDVKKLLEDIFKCPVYQIYQGSEGYYAVSCKFGNMHINEDMVLFEPLDEKGRIVEGKPCHRLLVTDLHKLSQPIIRYELNDIITVSKDKCKCGSNFRVIEKIQGRADDMFWGLLKESKKQHFIFQDYISRAIISTSDDIEEYQAIQKAYTRVILRIMAKEKANKAQLAKFLSKSIRKVFSQYGCIEPEVKVVFGRPLLNKKSNKLIRIKCELKGDLN